MLAFGGLGPAWLGTIFSPVVLKRYAPRMAADEGFTFPSLVRDIGRLTGIGDVTVKLAFYDARVGAWHESGLVSETVRQAEFSTASGSGRALTESASIAPAFSLAGGKLTMIGLPSAVLSQYTNFGDSGGARP